MEIRLGYSQLERLRLSENLVFDILLFVLNRVQGRISICFGIVVKYEMIFLHVLGVVFVFVIPRCSPISIITFDIKLCIGTNE